MPRLSPVIEFAGLPGAGKSTIARALPACWTHAASAELPALPLARRLAICRVALPFMLSLRPLAAKDARRLAKIAAELRFYEREATGPLVIDQGMIQKLWSTLHGRRHYSAAALDRLMASFAPSAPDLMVVVGTPPEVASARLDARRHGNARLQRLPPSERLPGLVAGQARYELLLELYRRHCGGQVLELSGTDTVAESAAQVVATLGRLGNTAERRAVSG